MKLNEFCSMVHNDAVHKGWWEDGDRPLPELLMLIVSELSEAMEDYRKNMMETHYISDKDGHRKPCGFWTEIADTFIRLGDMCGKHGVDIESIIAQKIEYNKKRPYRHGGKKA